MLNTRTADNGREGTSALLVRITRSEDRSHAIRFSALPGASPSPKSARIGT